MNPAFEYTEQIISEGLDKLIIKGFRIQAIKFVHENMRLSLADSSKYVENRAEQIIMRAAFVISPTIQQKIKKAVSE